jgi:hypothetical protein
MEWIIENKQWLFSGIAIAVPLAIVGWLVTNSKKQIRQRQKSGSGSINLQAGGNINMGNKRNENE